MFWGLGWAGNVDGYDGGAYVRAGGGESHFRWTMAFVVKGRDEVRERKETRVRTAVRFGDVEWRQNASPMTWRKVCARWAY